MPADTADTPPDRPESRLSPEELRRLAGKLSRFEDDRLSAEARRELVEHYFLGCCTPDELERAELLLAVDAKARELLRSLQEIRRESSNIDLTALVRRTHANTNEAEA